MVNSGRRQGQGYNFKRVDQSKGDERSTSGAIGRASSSLTGSTNPGRACVAGVANVNGCASTVKGSAAEMSGLPSTVIPHGGRPVPKAAAASAPVTAGQHSVAKFSTNVANALPASKTSAQCAHFAMVIENVD